MPVWILVLSQFSVVAFALLGGVFLAFSDFIMRSLRLTGGAGGLEAMQVINREVFRYVFMSLFIGMIPVSLVLAVGAYRNLAHSLPFLAAATIYAVGVFGVTAACNVPMNDTLAGLEATSAEGIAYWESTYLPRWTLWNSVRTAACLLASGLLQYGVCRALLDCDGSNWRG